MLFCAVDPDGDTGNVSTTTSSTAPRTALPSSSWGETLASLLASRALSIRSQSLLDTGGVDSWSDVAKAVSFQHAGTMVPVGAGT